jgi:hypothetical protein
MVVWFQKNEAQCVVLPQWDVRKVACQRIVYNALLGVDLITCKFCIYGKDQD